LIAYPAPLSSLITCANISGSRGARKREMERDNYSFDIGPMGAIGEQGSLLLRVNRNCPWNRCLFCSLYKGRKFEYRTVEEIKHDIDVVKFLADELAAVSLELGFNGRVNREVATALARKYPGAFGPGLADERMLDLRYASLGNVCNWLASGGRHVFLQDADALIMRTPELVAVLKHLRDAFPGIERITSYARSKSCIHKSREALREIHEAGLSRVLVGIESGYDPVLEFMRKGVTAGEHIEAGRKVIESGLGLIAFVMPGLGGKRWTEGHIRGTNRVLNEIQPQLVRLRSLAVQEASPLYAVWKSGDFEPLTDDGMVEEIRRLIEGLDCNCDIETGQLTNILFELRGRLPEQKGNLLHLIQRYQTMPPEQRMRFRFERCLKNYLSYLEQVGKLDESLISLVEEAIRCLEKSPGEAEPVVEQAIMAIKQRGIP
jgi:hypothetical protein